MLDGPPEEDILRGGAADPDLLAWFRAGHAALVETLSTADPGLVCATFMDAPSPLAFWARRQAHETAIHRADAESASGLRPEYDPEFAADGIDELIMGFGQRRKYRPSADGEAACGSGPPIPATPGTSVPKTAASGPAARTAARTRPARRPCTVTGAGVRRVPVPVEPQRRRPGGRHDLRRRRFPRTVAIQRARPLELTRCPPDPAACHRTNLHLPEMSYLRANVKYMFDTLQAGSGPDVSDALPDDPSVPLERVEAEICELAGHLAAATCRFLVLLGDFDTRRGWASWEMTSCAAWLSWKCQMSSGTAREHVRVARALRELPVIRGEFGAGRLSYAKVRALTRIATPQTEAGLAELAGPMTGNQLERFARAHRQVSTVDDAQPGCGAGGLAVRGGRFLSGTFRLPPLAGAVPLKALRAAAGDPEDPQEQKARVSAETPAQTRRKRP